MSDQTKTERTQSLKLIRRLPLIVSLIFGMLWGMMYLVFGGLHGMWRMFDKEFPLFIASALGLHPNSMSVLAGTLSAVGDGALGGFLLSWAFTFFIKKMVSPSP